MRRLMMVPVVLGLAACGGVERVPAPDVPERAGAVDLSIGMSDGPEEYAFGFVSGLAEGPDGDMFVSDAQQNVVRVFAPSGTYVRSIGRQGEGPGELERPCCIAFGPEGRLWVRDSGNRRYDSFADSAGTWTPGSTLRMVHFDAGYFAPITFSAGGDLVDIGHHVGSDGALVLWRFTRAPDGSVADSTPVEEPPPEALGTVVKTQEVTGGVSTYYFPQPQGPRSLVAHGPGGAWATAVSSAYAVTLHVGSDTIRIQGPAGQGPPLSAHEREAADAYIRSYVQRGGGNPSDYPPVPNHKALLSALFFDAAGRLWVERSVPEGEDRQADVYDRSGTLVERRRWPWAASLRFPSWVGHDDALGIATDSLGVQRVVRVRWGS